MRLNEAGAQRQDPSATALAVRTKIEPARVNQAGRPTPVELERRKARVMDVATELFATRGYAATSLVDIAKAAGVATRTLYQHFGDKEALFREVVFARDTGAVVPPPSLEIGDTLYAALLRTARYACDVAFRPKSIDLMRLMVAESTRFPELMQKVALSTFARFRRNIAKMFEALESSELIPTSAHARSAEIFSDLILGNTPILTYTSWDVAPPTDIDLDEKVELFILGRFGPVIAKRAHNKAVPRITQAQTDSASRPAADRKLPATKASEPQRPPRLKAEPSDCEVGARQRPKGRSRRLL
jgi:TetR/AcrR family transcriptional repressor of mexJK operon